MTMFSHHPSVPMGSLEGWFKFARDEAVNLGGEVMQSVHAFSDKYLTASVTGQVRDYPMDEVQSDLLSLSALINYLGTLAATSRFRAMKAKQALNTAEVARARQLLDHADASGRKLTKTQAEVDARIDCVAHEDALLLEQCRADLFANACTSMQELVNTMKKISDRMVREMELHPEA